MLSNINARPGTLQLPSISSCNVIDYLSLTFVRHKVLQTGMQATRRQSKIHCTGLAKQSDKKRFTASANLTLQLFGEENSRLADCLCHILHLFFLFVMARRKCPLHDSGDFISPKLSALLSLWRQAGWVGPLLWIWQDGKGMLCFYFTLTDHRLKHPVFRCVCSPPRPLFFYSKSSLFRFRFPVGQAKFLTQTWECWDMEHTWQ